MGIKIDVIFKLLFTLKTTLMVVIISGVFIFIPQLNENNHWTLMYIMIFVISSVILVICSISIFIQKINSKRKQKKQIKLAIQNFTLNDLLFFQKFKNNEEFIKVRIKVLDTLAYRKPSFINKIKFTRESYKVGDSFVREEYWIVGIADCYKPYWNKIMTRIAKMEK